MSLIASPLSCGQRATYNLPAALGDSVRILWVSPWVSQALEKEEEEQEEQEASAVDHGRKVMRSRHFSGKLGTRVTGSPP